MGNARDGVRIIDPRPRKLPNPAIALKYASHLETQHSRRNQRQLSGMLDMAAIY